MPFESNYSQWRFNNDSDIVHNIEKGLVFDYFNEESVQSLHNEGMDDRKKNVYYKKYIVNEDVCIFLQSRILKRTIRDGDFLIFA